MQHGLTQDNEQTSYNAYHFTLPQEVSDEGSPVNPLPLVEVNAQEGIPRKRINFHKQKAAMRRLRRVAKRIWIPVFLSLAVVALFILVVRNLPASESIKALMQLLQVTVASFGGIVVWREYNRNYHLKQAQFRKDNDKEERRRLEAEKAHDQKEAQFKEDQRQKQIQFEEKAQADRFNDIQNRFADKDDKTRASAALRLAEMGKEVLPGLFASGASPAFTEENFPYFLRAVSPLARALHMEENEAVLGAVKEALGTLASFTKGKDGDDRLLHKMITKIYDANITTKKKFTKALAEYKASEPGDGDMDLLESITRFTNEEEATKTVLLCFMNTDYYKGKQALFLKISEGRKNDDETSSLLLLVEKEAVHLTSARDALQVALKSLSRPVGAPLDDADADIWSNYKPTTSVIIKFAFLAGADLREVYLPKSSLNECDLQGAFLGKARLQGAFIENANAQNAKLGRAFCQGAELGGTQLQKAKLVNTWLQNVGCFGANFEAADMHGAKVADSSLNNAENIPLTVGGSDFRFYENGKTAVGKDKNLISQLDIKYPQYNLSYLLEEQNREREEGK